MSNVGNAGPAASELDCKLMLCEPRSAGQTPPEHLAALQVCQADLRAAVNDILREAQPHMLQQLLPDAMQPPTMAAAQLLAPNGQHQAISAQVASRSSETTIDLK
jgi:hypothetical protein